MNASLCCSISSLVFGFVSFFFFSVLTILIGVLCYLFVILICNSLMAYDIEHIFIHLSVSVYLLYEVSIQIFWPLLIGLFIYKLMSFKSSFTILHMSYTRYTFFSQLAVCHLILLTASFTEKGIHFNKD